MMKEIYDHLCGVLPKYTGGTSLQAHNTYDVNSFDLNGNQLSLTLDRDLVLDDENISLFNLYQKLDIQSFILDTHRNRVEISVSYEPFLSINQTIRLDGFDEQECNQDYKVLDIKKANSSYTITLKPDKPIPTEPSQLGYIKYYDNKLNYLLKDYALNADVLTFDIYKPDGFDILLDETKVAVCDKYNIATDLDNGVLNLIEADYSGSVFLLTTPSSSIVSTSVSRTKASDIANNFTKDNSVSQQCINSIAFELQVAIPINSTYGGDATLDDALNLLEVMQQTVMGYKPTSKSKHIDFSRITVENSPFLLGAVGSHIAFGFTLKTVQEFSIEQVAYVNAFDVAKLKQATFNNFTVNL